jgi:carboxyl-terminal processing protease
MKRNKNYLPIVLFATFAMGILLGGWLNFPTQFQIFSKNNSKNKLYKLLDFIDNEYVDKVNADTITNRTINTILAQLDPHSVYVSPSEQTQIAETMRGKFVGIGVNFYMYKDTLAIIKPIENGPSAKAGILSGDRILYADQTKLYGRKFQQIAFFQN